MNFRTDRGCTTPFRRQARIAPLWPKILVPLHGYSRQFANITSIFRLTHLN